VAARVDEVRPHRTDGGIVRPDEQRPAPVPPAAEIFAGGAPRRRAPEDQEAARPPERLQRGERARAGRPRPVRRNATDEPTRGDVDLDDFGAVRDQGPTTLAEPAARG